MSTAVNDEKFDALLDQPPQVFDPSIDAPPPGSTLKNDDDDDFERADSAKKVPCTMGCFNAVGIAT